ncbi:unnamed protein product [Rodentolepis nana]|uniref:Tyrosine-protein phosphatase domain-containing protein n=1 Tax=Rodentolepis nana TaxID=102285 RepID=A0A0R3TUX3_RODNA|nr:unnamed protein product [Rodentolepis nana]
MCFYFWRKPEPTFEVDLAAEMAEVIRNVESYNNMVEELRRNRRRNATIAGELSPHEPSTEVETISDSVSQKSD